VSYILSRTKYVQAATFVLAVSSILNIFFLYFINGTPNTLYYLTVGVLFAGLLLSVRTTAVIVTATIVVLQLILHLSPNPVDSGPITFAELFSGLILIFVYFRNVFENTRQNQITEALEKVEALNQTLSQTNAELTRASALARESARLKSEFMATMSHELRTPLNAMLGFSGILLEGIGGEFDDDARHMIERIDQNSKRLLTLINDVLDIAKIEAGRLELVITPVSPNKLVEMWRAQLSVLAQQKNLEFITEIDPDLPNQLYGDSERISQVATNLLSNAFKFTERGTVKLALKSKGDSWVLEVSDTGVGIPPHALNYIFDEFRQLDGSSRRAYGGTGLGLAIVRNLCRMMDGTVLVTSKLGEGSVFTVTLPLKSVPA
jgi:signal transduction histidine kinase